MYSEAIELYNYMRFEVLSETIATLSILLAARADGGTDREAGARWRLAVAGTEEGPDGLMR